MKLNTFLLAILFLLCSCAASQRKRILCDNSGKCWTATEAEWQQARDFGWFYKGYMAGGRINFARGYKMGYAQAVTDCDCDLDPNVGAIDPNLIRVF